MSTFLASAALMDKAQQAYFQMGFALFAFGFGTATIVSTLGILYMTVVIAPNATQRCSNALRERNILSFFAGIPILLVLLILVAVFHNSPVAVSITVLVSLVMLITGLTAASEDIGRRLFWACGKEGSRASHLAAGWLVFAFSSLTGIGTFLILPYVILSALGSLAVGAFGSKPAAKDAKDIKDIEFTGK